MAGVMIGIDPHKGSHTAYALDCGARRAGRGEAGCWMGRGRGRPGREGAVVALPVDHLGAGERVPGRRPLGGATAPGRDDLNDAVRVFGGRAGVRDPELTVEDHTEVMRIWSRRYHDLGRLRTQLLCRLHAVLCELVPGGFAKKLTVAHAVAILDRITPQTPIAQAKLDLAREMITDLQRLDAQRRDARARAARAVAASGTSITDIGVGLCGRARLLRDGRRPRPFAPTRRPIEVSSEDLRYPGNAPPPGVLPIVRTAERGPRVLRQEDRRRNDRQERAARAETQDQRHPLHAHAQRRAPASGQGPGRANGERLCIQRGRLTPRTASSSDKPLPGRNQP